MALRRARQAHARHGYVESFNGRMRDEFLNETQFRNLAHARDLVAAWVADYNTARPHSALGYQAPQASPCTSPTQSPDPLREMKAPCAGRLLTRAERHE
jgi:transposase InsO family protein